VDTARGAGIVTMPGRVTGTDLAQHDTADLRRSPLPSWLPRRVERVGNRGPAIWARPAETQLARCLNEAFRMLAEHA